MKNTIRNIDVKKDAAGNVTSLSAAFGPHHFLEVKANGEKVTIAIGATHHGVVLDASEVNGEFELAVGKISLGTRF